jgi:predicted dehydrogenase
MLTGEPSDLLVNLTDMQEHTHLNRKALRAGKHVFPEKTIGFAPCIWLLFKNYPLLLLPN